AHLPQHFQLTLQRAIIQCCSKGSQIVMIANAFQFDVFAIDEKAFVCVKLQRADSKRRFVNIYHFSTLRDCSNRDVEVWALVWWRSPKFWVGDRCCTFGDCIGACRNLQINWRDIGNRRASSAAVLVERKNLA